MRRTHYLVRARSFASTRDNANISSSEVTAISPKRMGIETVRRYREVDEKAARLLGSVTYPSIECRLRENSDIVSMSSGGSSEIGHMRGMGGGELDNEVHYKGIIIQRSQP